MKKLSAYAWAFIALFVLVATLGLCTLGSTATTGADLLVKANTPIYYLLDSEEAKLHEIYVHIGSVDAELGANVQVTVETSTSSASSASGTWSKHGGALRFANVASNDSSAAQGVNFRWWKIHSVTVSAAQKFRITFSENVTLCEIVCLDETGKRIDLQPLAVEGNYRTEEQARTLDAQGSFTKKEDAYHTLSKEEILARLSAETVLSGKAIVEGKGYFLDGNYNYLSSLLFAGSTGVFGESVFALRLPSFIAALVTLLFAYLLLHSLTRNEQCAFFFACFLVLGGVLPVLSAFAAPYAIVASALSASLYFMHRFYAKGISSNRVKRDGLNVFFSGVFAAFALAIEFAAVLPVAGILTLFAFGMRRQKRALALRLAKAEEVEDEAARAEILRKERVKGAEKRGVCWAYVLLSFVMTTAVLLLFAFVLAYSALVKTGGDGSGVVRMLLCGVKRSLVGDGYSVLEGGRQSAWNWWLPVRDMVLARGLNGAKNANLRCVSPSLVLSIASLLAVLFATVQVSLGFVRKTTEKGELRLRRNYFLLLGGMAATMLAGCIKGNTSALYALPFEICYFAFLPLVAAWAFERVKFKGVKGRAVSYALYALTAVALVTFALQTPCFYALGVQEGYLTAIRRVL